MVASKEELQAAHQHYQDLLKLKSEKLPGLDRWYRVELDELVQNRRSQKSGPYLTSEELVKLTRWKLTRGKFRPRLEQLAQSNADTDVRAKTKEAMMLLQPNNTLDQQKEALKIVSTLKGIGPATASAILALNHPGTLPFMSDEGLIHAAGLTGKPKYSVAEWQWYLEKMQERLEEEEWEGGVKELEEAAWAYAQSLNAPNSSPSDPALRKRKGATKSSSEQPQPSSKRSRTKRRM